MLDIKFIRENRKTVESAIKKRHEDISVSALIDIEEKRLDLLREIEVLRSRRNTVSEEIGRLKKAKQDASGLIAEMKSDRKSTRLNSSHTDISRMPSSA